MFFSLDKAKSSRVWSCCKTLHDKYVTFLARPGSCLATLVLREMRDHIYIGTYCQYGEEKGFWSCKKQREPKRLTLLTPFLRVVAPPFGPVGFGGNKVSHGLAVMFLARLERPFFLAKISRLAGCEMRNSCSHITPRNSCSCITP
jgi:hypothetical protein